jgi:hypothetical protein
VNVSLVDPFNGWDIQLQADPTIINAASLSITGNILSANGQTIEFTNCINGMGLNCQITGTADGPGIVHSAVGFLGPAPFSTTATGLLFTVTYQVVGNGTSQIAFLRDIIKNPPITVQHSDSPAVFSNTGVLLPHAEFSWTDPYSPDPTQVFEGDPVTFNASASSDPNPGGSIVRYQWDFGDGSGGAFTTNLTIAHLYQRTGQNLTGPFTVELTVTNNQGVKGSAKHGLIVQKNEFRDLGIDDIRASKQDNILPGTILNITVFVTNKGRGTTETMFNLTLSVEISPRNIKGLGTRQFQGNLLPGSTKSLSFSWDTTGVAPNTYQIDAYVPPLRNATGTIVERNIQNNNRFLIVRIASPVQNSLIPFTMPQFAALVFSALVAVGVASTAVQQITARKKRLSQEML